MNSRLSHILLAPHLSEKSMFVKDKDNVYVFKVRPDANKIEIKKAVETHFKVAVSDVKTSLVKPPRKRVGKSMGRKASWKKAYVTVTPGSGEIEYFEGT